MARKFACHSPSTGRSCIRKYSFPPGFAVVAISEAKKKAKRKAQCRVGPAEVCSKVPLLPPLQAAQLCWPTLHRRRKISARKRGIQFRMAIFCSWPVSERGAHFQETIEQNTKHVLDELEENLEAAGSLSSGVRCRFRQ